MKPCDLGELRREKPSKPGCKTQVLTSSLTNTSWPSSFHTAGAWQAVLTPCNTAIFRLGLKGTVSTC